MDHSIRLRTLPAHHALVWTGPVSIEELGATIADRLARLRAAGGKATEADPPYTAFLGPVNASENGPIEVVLPLTAPISPPEGCSARHVAAVEAATATVRGDQAKFPAILGAYDAVFMWAQAHGRAPAGPPREILLNEDASAFEIALPLM